MGGPPAHYGSTYEHQSTLERLPVPQLTDTFRKYLVSIKPHVTNEEYNTTSRLVDDFLKTGGQGERLQQLLIERNNSQELASTSWLLAWWNRLAYFEYREPNVINSNYFLRFDAGVPRAIASQPNPQVMRAACLVRSFVQYHLAIECGELPCEFTGAGENRRPMDMDMYRYLFASCRVPLDDGSDQFVHYNTASNGRSYASNGPNDCRDDSPYSKHYHPLVSTAFMTNMPRHIVVFRRNRIYKVTAIESDGPITVASSLADLMSRLLFVLNDADGDGSDGENVGLLTTEHRDTWGKAHRELVADAHNATVMEDLQCSLFAVCLDEDVIAEGDVETATAESLLHGNGNNRWFDKSFQVVVAADGNAGYNGEHSLVDGGPVIAFINSVLEVADDRYAAVIVSQVTGLTDPAQDVQSLKFNVNHKIKGYIKDARVNFEKRLLEQTECAARCDMFGKDTIKSFKVSPDAFFQIALHLTYHRLHSGFAACYETAQMRRFLHGRTETIRTCTNETAAYVKEMNAAWKRGVPAKGPDCTRLADLLRSAASAHIRTIKECMAGNGIDRHMFGLKRIAVENKIVPHSVFSDPAFARSSHWNISTSQMSSTRFSSGFGAVCDDGYGVCYNLARPHSITWHTNSRFKTGIAARDFNAELHRSLRWMHDLMTADSSKARL
eukprot:TRINITY_DN5637_c0_g1_i1.p1 TRINITY_DN5637_c0_g1~~TRINITY_DN5637_c0_g1_i1.p1  ORF type:complete len:698 (-),score=117.57 TRINITY_DN5637_c0_g1_i1:180-2183(-)